MARRLPGALRSHAGCSLQGRTSAHGSPKRSALAEAEERRKYGVTIVGIKSVGKDFSYPTPTFIVNEGDLTIVWARGARSSSSPTRSRRLDRTTSGPGAVF